MEEHPIPPQAPQGEPQETITRISGMYQNWFLDYASYVILERAVPALEDGFKPVQRRIMHSMDELEDGRYNKVANIVGNTMKYHPHGDASIGDAIIQLGQKELLIDTQGSWGNILTGDDAAAPRYIEARLSKFALDVLFSPKVTQWQKSYDGRNDEPVHLPVKFPLLLAQGAEGIAVGLSTKILPHNFNELIDASVLYLEGKPFELYPDFPTAGIMDAAGYNDGMRGGRIRVRARIAQRDKSTLVITEIPFGTTTSSLIDSILKANEKGKIKVLKVDDNTAANVEILVHLPKGISPDKTIDALYAFTDCETSVSPLCCVIEGSRPLFIGVSDILKKSTDRTVEILKKELEVKLDDLEQKWHNASLEKIFIREEMYIDFKNYSDKESLYAYLYKRFEPFAEQLLRPITDEDLERLTQIPMIRITKYDTYKAEENLLKIEENIAEVKDHLANLIALDYFRNLQKKYGKGKDRKTEIRPFDTIEATKVVVRNLKLYVNREEGFVGTSLKKDEYVADCSDIDDIIVFTADGKMIITKVTEKSYIGKNIVHVGVFKKNDTRTVYNLVYRNGNDKISYIKRFTVTGIIRDKEYDVVEPHKDSQVLYFSANPNGEAEVISVILRVHRLNTEGRGELLGSFKGEDRLLLISKDAIVKTVIPDLSLHFDPNLLIIEKWNPEKPISVIHYEGEKERYFVKRFLVENPNREELVISDHPKSQLLFVSTQWRPMAEVVFTKTGRERAENQTVNIEEFIAIKGIKAIGNQLTTERIKEIVPLEPLPYEEPQEEETPTEEEETATPEVIQPDLFSGLDQ